MILVLIALLAVAGLVVLYRSMNEQRVKLMSFIIVVLVAVNLLNEVVAGLRYGGGNFSELQQGKKYTLLREVYRPVQQQPPLLREELLVVDYLTQRMKAG